MDNVLRYINKLYRFKQKIYMFHEKYLYHMSMNIEQTQVVSILTDLIIFKAIVSLININVIFFFNLTLIYII